MTRDARAILDELVAARNERSAQRAARVLREDIRYWDSQHGDVEGRDAVAAVLTALDARFELETVAAQEDDAVAEVQIDEGGRSHRSTEVYRLDGGAVAGVKAYFDVHRYPRPVMTPISPIPPAPPLSPPDRLLCGPGPTNVEPSVLDAMRQSMMGHLDPTMHELLLDLVEMQRAVYGVEGDAVTLPLQATGMSGMETGIVNLVSRGDVVIVGYAGFFGRRIAQMAARHGAEVVEVTRDWGEIVPNEALLEALDERPEARLLAVVHAETSTGAQHPLAELGAALRDRDTLLLADCVTSLGGIPLAFSEWGVDFAYSCTQKALGAPPGMSPIAFSERAMERCRTRDHQVPFSFDIELLLDYWVRRPATYHHTAPILHIYALYQALRHALDEGLEARWARHEEAGRYLQGKVCERGFDLVADPEHQLPHLTAVRVPDRFDGKRVQQRLLDEHGIEVGGGLGPDAPPMWRIGLMGPNASIDVADRVLTAFDAVLASEPAAE